MELKDKFIWYKNICSPCIFFFLYMYLIIYIFILEKQREPTNQRGLHLLLVHVCWLHSPDKGPQQLELGQAEARSLELRKALLEPDLQSHVHSSRNQN